MEEHLDIEEGQRLAAAKDFAYRHRFLLATLVVAVVLGAAAGWGYNRYRHSQQVAASGFYQKGLQALSQDRDGDARQAFKALIADHPGTSYAAMGRVLRARLLHHDGSSEQALKVLEPLVAGDTGPVDARHVAVEEAARIHWDQGDVQAALDTLDRIAPSAYQPSYFQLRGDLLAAAKRPEAARDAYRQALAQTGSEPLRPGIEARLDELPAGADNDSGGADQ